MMIKSPYTYFGGKSTVSDQIWQALGDVPNYVEPFLGSAAVLLSRPDDHFAGGMRLETVNDKDGYISNFWRAVKADARKVADYADWPVNECVPAGTMIATPDGAIPVEDIRPGMVVLGERDGQVVETTVLATKQNEASNFYQVGALQLTGNHPVWTFEHGYVEASQLATNMHLGVLDRPVDEIGLVVLQSQHEQSTLENLHTERPAHREGEVCGCHISRQGPLQRASVSCRDGRQDAPRLLDTFSDCSGIAPDLPNLRRGARRRLASGRTPLDSTLSGSVRTGQSYRWRRWRTGVCANAGITRTVVEDACGCPLCAGAGSRDAGQTPHAGSGRENPRHQHRAGHAGQYETKGIASPEGQAAVCRAPRKTQRLASRQNPVRRTQAEDSQYDHEPQACPVRGDSADISLHHSGSARIGSDRTVGFSSHSQGLPLQRVSLATPIAVYNFQTTTGNYFANRILVHNCDLHARHAWLVGQRESLTARLEGDPDWYDAKIAGWWVWGMACWIGSGFCSGEGPWQQVNGELVKVDSDAGRGVKRSLVHLGNAGRGVQRQLVHLGDAGRGVQRKRIQLGNQWSEGHGVRSTYGQNSLYDWFDALQARLKRVRVASGDWTRVMTPAVTICHGLTGVLLDPPYITDNREQVYYHDGHSIAAEVRDWAIANGDNPLFRIVYCGYEGGFAWPESWRAVAWKAPGGFQSTDKGNRERERLYLSPHCLRPSQQLSLFDLLVA